MTFLHKVLTTTRILVIHITSNSCNNSTSKTREVYHRLLFHRVNSLQDLQPLPIPILPTNTTSIVLTKLMDSVIYHLTPYSATHYLPSHHKRIIPKRIWVADP
jgi:hypothetical protein